MLAPRARLGLLALALLPLAWSTPRAQQILPVHAEAVRFAVIGDMGTGGRRQREVGRAMAEVRKAFPFTFVLTTGDNIYGSEDPRDMERKFVLPYKALLDADVTFHASLGNHDDPSQRFYKLFNMDERRYYTFREGPVRFFALDSTAMNEAQLAWLEAELKDSDAPWKVAYFHHPLYSSGLRHGPTLVLRQALEPLLATYDVQVVFNGHEHFYERLTPQRGVQYFITGAGGRLRRGNIRPSGQTAAGFDRDNSFMIVEVAGDRLYFESIARNGTTVDAGVVHRAGGTDTLTTPGSDTPGAATVTNRP